MQAEIDSFLLALVCFCKISLQIEEKKREFMIFANNFRIDKVKSDISAKIGDKEN